MSGTEFEELPEGDPAEETEGSESAKVETLPCQWINLSTALKTFAEFSGKTQSARHITPLHWYVACRLVLEGGFRPDEVTPHPPFVLNSKDGRHFLSFDPSVATKEEAIVLGGLKTKQVDVVVNKSRLGPVVAVSCKGMTGALRNLTNRMEETIGECTNLHITYPAMVFGYVFLLRAHREERGAAAAAAAITEEDETPTPPKRNDIAIAADGPVEGLVRFHKALTELTGRRGIRDDGSRYEAVSLAMIEMESSAQGGLLADFPPTDDPLRLETFFSSMYYRFDERYVYSAPTLNSVTRRLFWDPESPIFEMDPSYPIMDYEIRKSDWTPPPPKPRRGKLST